MKQIKIIAVMLAIGLVLALVPASPARAIVPENTYYIAFPVWGFINSPFNLTWTGLDCIDFDQDTVNWNGVYADRGPYEITMVEDTITHFTATVNPNVDIVFQGKLNIHGLVDRKGPGSSLTWVGSGKLRGWLFGFVPPTRTNVTGMAIQDAYGVCAGVMGTRGGEQNWVRAD